MKAIRIITCSNTSEAYLIKGLLLNEGIDCFLTNENLTTLMPHYNYMLGSGIQIFVDESNIIKAQEIIDNLSLNNNKKPSCPECHSQNVNIGLGKNKSLKILNVIISLLAFIPFGNVKPQYHCNAEF